MGIPIALEVGRKAGHSGHALGLDAAEILVALDEPHLVVAKLDDVAIGESLAFDALANFTKVPFAMLVLQLSCAWEASLPTSAANLSTKA